MPAPLSSLITSIVSGAVTIAWLIMLTRSDGFHTKLGVMFKFDLGLYNMQVGPSWGTTVLNAVGPTKWIVSKFMKRNDEGKIINHQLTIQMMKQNVCALPHTILQALGMDSAEACTLWMYVEWSSFFLLIFALLGLVFLGLGTGFSHYYWSNDPRKKTRQCSQMWFVIAISFFWVGMFQYTIATMDFGKWLKMWGENEAPTFSHNYMFSCVLCVLSTLPLVIQLVFAGPHEMEDINEEVHDIKRTAREEAMGQALLPGGGMQAQQGYGGTNCDTGYGQQQGYGGGQQQPMGYDTGYGQQQGYGGGQQQPYQGGGGGGDFGIGGGGGGGQYGGGAPPMGGPQLGGPSLGGPPMGGMDGGGLDGMEHGGGRTDAPLPIRPTARIA